MNTLEQPFIFKKHMEHSNFEFFHYKDDTKVEVEYHDHDFYEVYFFISGKVTYMVEGKSYSLKPGDILLVNNKELHKPVIEQGSVYERIVVWINPEYIGRLCTHTSDLLMCFESTTINKCNLLRPDVKTRSIIKNLLTKLNVVYSEKGYGNDILAEIYLIELIVYLNKIYLETDIDDIVGDIIYNFKINDIIHHINQNLDTNLSLENLSAKFYTSKYHLLREFKKHTGYTLHSYIHKKRLIAAKACLKQGMSITEVCQACGFNDYSNFIRVFTRTFKISPRKYSKQFSTLR